jgi:cardiolipin synthase
VAGGGAAVVSDRVLTLPNALSVLRLVGVPVFLWAILAGQDAIALVILTLSGVSDYLDGKIARRYGLVSRIGQLLDPLADRLYIATTLFGLAWRDIIPWWLVVVLVSREVLLAAVLWWIRRYGQTGLPVHFVGKAATFNLLYAFPLLLLGQGESTFAAWARCSTGSPGSCTSSRPARWPSGPPQSGTEPGSHGSHLPPRLPGPRQRAGTPARRVHDAAHVDDGTSARPRVCRGGSAA